MVENSLQITINGGAVLALVVICVIAIISAAVVITDVLKK